MGRCLRPFNPPMTICLLKCLLPSLWSSVPSIALCPLSGSLSPLHGRLPPLRPSAPSTVVCPLYSPFSPLWPYVSSLTLTQKSLNKFLHCVFIYWLISLIWKLLTPPLKQLFNVDTAGFLPASLRSQSPLQWKWREYYSAQVTLKRNIVCVMKIILKHFSCDKIVYNTYCDIPKRI